MKYFYFFLIMLTYLNIFAAKRNLIAISQGIVSPSITSNLVLANGYTFQNPAGIAY